MQIRLGANYFKINGNYFRERSSSYHVNGRDKNNVLVQKTKPHIENVKLFFFFEEVSAVAR